MKILITGGTTFVSRYAAEHFVSKGEEVFVLNRNSRPQSQGVHLINCDRLNLGNKVANEHFDLILDITAYTDEHIKALLKSVFRLMITFSSVQVRFIPKLIPSRLPKIKLAVKILSGAITELTNSMQKNTYLILSKMRIFFVRRIFTVCMKICTEKHFPLIVLF